MLFIRKGYDVISQGKGFQWVLISPVVQFTVKLKQFHAKGIITMRIRL